MRHETDSIAVEITERGRGFLEEVENEKLSSGPDAVIFEVLRRERSLFVKCPVCQASIESSMPSVECLFDQTVFCRPCVESLSSDKQTCWICNLVSFKDMLEALS